MPDPLSWHRVILRRGYGVASGQGTGSPYPAGTIATQAPLFAEHGIDLSPFHPGTLNLDVTPGEWRLQKPDAQVEHLRWSELHQPETFSFWWGQLRLPAAPSGAAPHAAEPLTCLVYHPHPETKQRHGQQPGVLEVLAPWIEGLAPETTMELGLDPRRCRVIQPARLRARLLEFLKFRVLAAQETFFDDLRQGKEQLDLDRFRSWLAAAGWGEALDLRDADLAATLEQARQLYL
ncbi:hypothetical protein [Synechococcus sp. CCY9202]|uniref:hypothetical protein n=1 Tax=Synechococcus sp. CCY9202 TaxID=174698 RepID=UPI002B1FBB36|nr:hypothetical protein [Synechococcus sp. CCY9202]MEA5423199.1 hypothetical protein [Synechococcus sp. CCY9202]